MGKPSLRVMTGFTLIETMFILVIVSVAIALGLGFNQERILTEKIDRTVLQMQQILNASLSYYVSNGKWPTALSDLTASGKYLPATVVSPWDGTDYVITNEPVATNEFLVLTLTLPAITNQAAIAAVIAGRLPMASSTAGGVVTSRVNIPGQDLQNASSMNYAGLYRHGACVPAPSCPVDPKGNKLTPEVLIVPVSVSGLNDVGSAAVYPISSFTAYSSSDVPIASPIACTGSTSGTPGSTAAPACPDPGAAGASATGTYWRACVQVVTERGDLSGTGTDAASWGQYVTLGAFTRCQLKGTGITTEPEGSDESIFSN